MTPSESGPAERPRPSRWSRVRRLLVTGVVTYLLVAGCGVLYAATDEAGVPSDDPELPAGIAAGAEQRVCASGGCWREFTLSWADGLTRAEAVDRLAPLLGCGWTNPITFRSTCTSVDDRPGGPLRLVVQFDRS